MPDEIKHTWSLVCIEYWNTLLTTLNIYKMKCIPAQHFVLFPSLTSPNNTKNPEALQATIPPLTPRNTHPTHLLPPALSQTNFLF
jgi:hypothetical protein